MQHVASMKVPQPDGAVVGGRHEKVMVQGVTLQNVHRTLVPHQALSLLPCLGVPHPYGVVAD